MGRITQLVDPPKYPLWLGKLWTFFCVLIAVVCIAVIPCLRDDSAFFLLPTVPVITHTLAVTVITIVFVMLVHLAKVRYIRRKTSTNHPAFSRKFQFTLS